MNMKFTTHPPVGETPEMRFFLTAYDQIRSLVHAVGRLTNYSINKALNQPGARIIQYHGINCEGGLTTAQFEAHLAVVKKHFCLIGLAEFMDRRTAHSLSGNEVVLTFDDGVQNHFTDVYPVLQRHKAPATFFVCPMLIETGRWLWNRELRERLKVMQPLERSNLALAFGLPSVEIEDIVESTKMLAPAERESIENSVRNYSSAFQATSSQQNANLPLTWAQLGSLDPTLVTVGSHTLTHSILTTLELVDAEADLRESRAMLESRLQRPVEYFCYPNGCYNATVAEAAGRYYRASVTSIEDLVSAHSACNLLPRIAASNGIDAFLWNLHRR